MKDGTVQNNISYEADFLKKLESIVLKHQDGDKASLLLKKYMIAINIFFTIQADVHQTDEWKSILHHVQYLNYYLEKEVAGKKNRTILNNMAIGCAVEMLIHYGLPRIHAINSMKPWLGVSKTKATTANQDFRSEWGKGIAGTAGIVFAEGLRAEKIFRENGKFPSNHPNAERAYKRCLKFFDEDQAYLFFKSIQNKRM